MNELINKRVSCQQANNFPLTYYPRISISTKDKKDLFTNFLKNKLKQLKLKLNKDNNNQKKTYFIKESTAEQEYQSKNSNVCDLTLVKAGGLTDENMDKINIRFDSLLKYDTK